jgi:hypothetical protein
MVQSDMERLVDNLEAIQNYIAQSDDETFRGQYYMLTD